MFAFYQRGSREGGEDDELLENGQVQFDTTPIVGKLSSNVGEHRYSGNAGGLPNKM